MKLCSKCKINPQRPNQRYCKSCHAEYVKKTRPKYSELSEEQKKKSNARAYANVYKRRGLLVPQFCKCGNRNKLNLQMHHTDYDKPLDVTWLCQECHTKEHMEKG